MSAEKHFGKYSKTPAVFSPVINRSLMLLQNSKALFLNIGQLCPRKVSLILWIQRKYLNYCLRSHQLARK
jgi:hypothetical protein